MQKKKTEEFPTPTNLTDSINLCMEAGKKAKILNDVLLAMMYAYSETHKQSNDADSPQEYVTREAKISCSCGEYSILLDAEEDYGVIAVNGKPLLTCKDCKENINIRRFGVCYAEVKSDGNFLRPPGIRVGTIGGKGIYNCIPDLVNRWRQNGSSLLIKDAESGEFVEALMTGAYALCRYGGIIEVNEVPENEREQEELQWIPSNILQLDGKSRQEQELKNRIAAINEKVENKKVKDFENAEKYDALLWNQEKIDKVWDKCLDFYYHYEVQVDPRMLLAIIFQEGTGSFDTSSENKAADGGNGVEFDFDRDCRKAVDLLGGKIIAYLRYHNDFSTARQAAYEKKLPGLADKSSDDILHYLNWETPKLVLLEAKDRFKMAPYAVDSRWHRKVRRIYSDLVNLDVEKKTQEYTNYILTLDSCIFEKTAKEEGIDVNKEVIFKAVKNGADEKAKPTGEYTIIGEFI